MYRPLVLAARHALPVTHGQLWTHQRLLAVPDILLALCSAGEPDVIRDRGHACTGDWLSVQMLKSYNNGCQSPAAVARCTTGLHTWLR